MWFKNGVDTMWKDLSPTTGRSQNMELFEHKTRAMNSLWFSDCLYFISYYCNQCQDFLYLKLSFTFHIKGSQEKFGIHVAMLLLEIIIHFSVWLCGRWLPYSLQVLLPTEIWNMHAMKKPKMWRRVPMSTLLCSMVKICVHYFCIKVTKTSISSYH